MQKNKDNSVSVVVNEVKDGLNRLADLLEKDIRGVHIGCYSVALVGLTIAIRKVRPISKFKKPYDIPDHFIKEKRELSGLVRRIDPNGAVLMVEHKPLVNLPIWRAGQLPVKISGVNVSGLGINWLQSIVTGQEVKFIPVIKTQNFVQCQVLLVQNTKDGKDLMNIGERLVKIGFAHAEPIPRQLEDPSLLSYYKQLKAAENYALRNKLGLKYYIKPTLHAANTAIQSISDLSRRLSKTIRMQLKSGSYVSTA